MAYKKSVSDNFKREKEEAEIKRKQEEVIPGENKRTRIRVVRFSISDIAKAREVTNFAIHKATSRKVVNPRDLISLSKFVLKGRGDKECRLCGQTLKKEETNESKRLE